jgi:hypothetical protein
MPPIPHQMHTRQTNEAQPLLQTGEMHLQTTFYRILRCMNNARRSTDGWHKSGKSTKLANPNKCHGNPQVLRIYGILPLLYQGLLKDHPTTTTTNTFNDPLVMELRGTNSIWDITKCHDWQTGTPTTRLHKTILPPHRCIGIWRGSHTLIGRRVWWLEHHPKTQTTPSCILLSHLHQNGAQLRHLWPRTSSDHESHHTLAPILNLDEGTLHHSHRPHKFAALELAKETKQTNCTMEQQTSRLQFQASTCPWETTYGHRCPITTPGSRQRQRRQPTNDYDPRSSVHKTSRPRLWWLNQTHNNNNLKTTITPWWKSGKEHTQLNM